MAKPISSTPALPPEIFYQFLKDQDDMIKEIKPLSQAERQKRLDREKELDKIFQLSDPKDVFKTQK